MRIFVYIVLIVSLLAGAGYIQNKDGAQHPMSYKKVKNPYWKNIKKSLGFN